MAAPTATIAQMSVMPEGHPADSHRHAHGPRGAVGERASHGNVHVLEHRQNDDNREGQDDAHDAQQRRRIAHRRANLREEAVLLVVVDAEGAQHFLQAARGLAHAHHIHGVAGEGAGRLHGDRQRIPGAQAPVNALAGRLQSHIPNVLGEHSHGLVSLDARRQHHGNALAEEADACAIEFWFGHGVPCPSSSRCNDRYSSCRRQWCLRRHWRQRSNLRASSCSA